MTEKCVMCGDWSRELERLQILLISIRTPILSLKLRYRLHPRRLAQQYSPCTVADWRMGDRGTSRVLSKLEASLAAGNFYEAHQMYRTLSYRYTIARKWEPLLDLLFHGAIHLLDAGQLGSGADLAQLFAEKLEESLTGVSEPVLLRLGQLLSKIPSAGADADAEASKGVVDKAKLTDTIIGWSKVHQQLLPPSRPLPSQ